MREKLLKVRYSVYNKHNILKSIHIYTQLKLNTLKIYFELSRKSDKKYDYFVL